MKQLSFDFIMLALLSIWGCGNDQESTNHAIQDSLIVGKWQMVEYAGGSVNALDTYRLIKPDSLIIYNRDFGEQHYKIFKLSKDSLIRQIKRQRIYADNIDEPVIGEIKKDIREQIDSTFFERSPFYGMMIITKYELNETDEAITYFINDGASCIFQLCEQTGTARERNGGNGHNKNGCCPHT